MRVAVEISLLTHSDCHIVLGIPQLSVAKWSRVCNIFTPDNSSDLDLIPEGIGKGALPYSNPFKSYVKKPRGGRFATPRCPRVKSSIASTLSQQ